MSNQFKFSLPGTDSGAKARLDQFRNGFIAHASALGYDAEDISNVVVPVDQFAEDLFDRNVIEDQLRQAVNVKDKSLDQARKAVRLYVNRVIHNPAVTPEMLASMGIVPISQPAGPVQTPSKVSAAPSADGSCEIRWSANGNARRTVYVVETFTEGSGWSWAANTTKRRWIDKNATPGVPKQYRVRAQRGDQSSKPSAAAGIYSATVFKTLPKAA